MLLFERSKYDDDDVDVRKIKVWWCCCSKDQSMMMMMSLFKRAQYDDAVVADQNVKMLKMLLLIKRSKCWRWCCWSKGQSAKDVVDRSSQSINDDEDWRWRLHNVEKLPMIYRCITLMMLMMYSPTIVVVDVVVEYPSR